MIRSSSIWALLIAQNTKTVIWSRWDDYKIHIVYVRCTVVIKQFDVSVWLLRQVNYILCYKWFYDRWQYCVHHHSRRKSWDCVLIIILILNFPHSVRIAELVAFAEYIYVTALCSCWEGSISREEIIVCVGTVVIFRLTRFTFYYKLCLMFMMNTLYCTVPCAPICNWIEAVNNIHSICLLFFHIWWTQCW